MKKSISVLVLTTSFPLRSAVAVGIHIIEKCRHLAQNGVAVKVIAPHHPGEKRKEIMNGLKISRFRYFFPVRYQRLAYGAGIPTNLANSRLARLQLPLFLLSFVIAALKEAASVDVIHCHWSIAGLAGVVAGKLFKKKVILMMHGAEVFVLGKSRVLRFLLQHIDCLISNSTFTEKKTLAVYPVPKHVVIPPGVDTDRFSPRHATAGLRRSLNIAADDIFVLSIGKFIPRKGFEYLIEAFNIIVNRHKINHIKLRIGGRGPLKTNYEQLIRRYSLQRFIEFLGYIPDDQMPAYYSAADIFVLPSIIDDRGDTEGLGVVFLEANACKTPVIGSRVGGIPDVIVDGENGFLVEQKNSLDLADKIYDLSGDVSLRNRMGKNGRRIVKDNFNWDKIAKKIIGIYDLLLDEKTA